MNKSEHHNVVVVGHVDHGKSTLLGRLMLNSGLVHKEKIDKVTKICQEKQLNFEPAFLFDALAEEQDQGVTIDTTRVIYESNNIKYCLIDVPGHLEFLKNMITGASEAFNGILIVDIEEGIQAQTRRHLSILAMLGIENVLITINKMDKVSFNQTSFSELSAQLTELVKTYQINLNAIIPISALFDVNIGNSSDTKPEFTWYKGLNFTKALENLVLNYKPASCDNLSIILQDVYKFNDNRYFVGKVLSGTIKPDDRIMFFPSGKQSSVKSIETYPSQSIETATANETVALCLNDQIYVERGEVIAFSHAAPNVDNSFVVNLAWLISDVLDINKKYLFKIGCAQTYAKVKIDSSDENMSMSLGDIRLVTLELDKPVAFALKSTNSQLANFVLCDEYRTVACGNIINLITSDSQVAPKPQNVSKELGFINRLQRQSVNKHKSCVLWLTGLSGSGKSSLARSLEQDLFNKGYQVIVLDADNLRLGLCSDLGFTPGDRSQNNRRIAHVANLFKEAGFIVIVACISPYIKDRQLARQIISDDDFKEIFVFCPLEICQLRDPKGLYKHDGTANSMTGVQSPYQIPLNPHLRIDTSELSIEEEIELVNDFMLKHGILATKLKNNKAKLSKILN